MKTSNIVLILGLIFGLYLISCESEKDTNLDDSEFIIEFSDSTLIIENDLLFYDSSTHILFLKQGFDLNQSISGFNVLVDNDKIYAGIIYSCHLSNPPPSPFFIGDCLFYANGGGNDIVEMGYYPINPSSIDLRNDPRIINALKNSNLLHNGLTCQIDSINVNSFDNYSEVTCTITIKNNDNINYYILDPEKMGEQNFSYFIGGLYFRRIDNQADASLRWLNSNSDWADLTINDFSVLENDSEVTYTFKSSDYNKMDKGIYKVRFNFCGTKHETSKFDLNQDNGRIWVGIVESSNDSILVE
jgi:hypothetical protein